MKPTLGPSMSGTKCDRDILPIFPAERGGKSVCDEAIWGNPLI